VARSLACRNRTCRAMATVRLAAQLPEADRGDRNHDANHNQDGRTTAARLWRREFGRPEDSGTNSAARRRVTIERSTSSSACARRLRLPVAGLLVIVPLCDLRTVAVAVDCVPGAGASRACGRVGAQRWRPGRPRPRTRLHSSELAVHMLEVVAQRQRRRQPGQPVEHPAAHVLGPLRRDRTHR
jgi:hypothetical protein